MQIRRNSPFPLRLLALLCAVLHLAAVPVRAAEPPRGLAAVFMVQHAGYPADGAKKINPTVLSAAFAEFGK